MTEPSKFCASCGKPMVGEAAFCAACGSPTSSVTAPKPKAQIGFLKSLVTATAVIALVAWCSSQREHSPANPLLDAGSTYEAIERITLLEDRDIDYPATAMQMQEKTVGTIEPGETFEVRKREAFPDVWYFLVSHRNPALRGWALRGWTKAKTPGPR